MPPALAKLLRTTREHSETTVDNRRTDMKTEQSELSAELMQAKVRLALITRMAQHNLENSPDRADSPRS